MGSIVKYYFISYMWQELSIRKHAMYAINQHPFDWLHDARRAFLGATVTITWWTEISEAEFNRFHEVAD